MCKVDSLRPLLWCLAGALLCCPLLRADAPAGRYSVTGQSVQDSVTTLTWTQQPGAARDWASAQAYCSQLGLDGQVWRLPALKELLSLVDPTRFGPALDPTAFPNNPANGWLWTASRYARSRQEMWVVRISDGASVHAIPDDKNLVRCVR